MIRFLHLSDLHIGWRPSFLAEDEAKKLQQERDDVLAQAVDYAVSPEYEIDLVIIAGDLFETHRPSQDLVEYTIDRLRECTAAGKLVVTVPGNHDEITYRDSVYWQAQGRWPGILVTNPMPELVAQVEIKGHQLYIYSLAYVGGITKTEPPIKDFPKVNQAGFHLGIFHGSYNWQAGERSLPLDPEGLARTGYDYVALGHFHSYQAFSIGQGLGVYPGIAAGKGFYDLGTGELVMGEWQPETGVKLTKLPVKVPQFEYRQLDISQAGDQDALVSLIEDQRDPDALVRIELEGITGFLFDHRWLQERTQHYFRYLELVDNSYYLSSDALDQLSQEKTITGFFIRRMKERLEQATSEEEKRLLNRALTRGMLALQGGKQLG